MRSCFREHGVPEHSAGAFEQYMQHCSCLPASGAVHRDCPVPQIPMLGQFWSQQQQEQPDVTVPTDVQFTRNTHARCCCCSVLAVLNDHGQCTRHSSADSDHPPGHQHSSQGTSRDNSQPDTSRSNRDSSRHHCSWQQAGHQCQCPLHHCEDQQPER